MQEAVKQPDTGGLGFFPTAPTLPVLSVFPRLMAAGLTVSLFGGAFGVEPRDSLARPVKETVLFIIRHSVEFPA